MRNTTLCPQENSINDRLADKEYLESFSEVVGSMLDNSESK